MMMIMMIDKYVILCKKRGGGETYLEVRLEYSMGNDDDKEYLEYSIA